MSARLSVLVDGFNFYHSIKDLMDEGLDQGASLKWFDLRALAESFLHQIEITGEKEISSVHYFSAFASHKMKDDPDHVNRHQQYLRVLRHTNVETHMHRFKKRVRDCKHCAQPVKFHEEKESDVAIASKLIQVFVEDSADVAVVITGDTDMAPAVRCVFEMFPAAQIWFGFPYKRKNQELANLVKGRGGTFKIHPHSYRRHVLPDPFVTKRNKEVHKPSGW